MDSGCLYLFVLLCTGYAHAAPHDNRADDGWINFKYQYKKFYSNEVEEKFRKNVFHENQQKIAEHNEKYEAGIHSYKLKINQYGDMLFEEYKNYMHPQNNTLTRLRRIPRGGVFAMANASVELPDFVDWRKQGAVTPVQDQGLTCGSCWAFSAIGALEGQYFKKTGILRLLSAQSLIDCTTDYGNLGCGGGSAALSFQFVVDHKGLESEEEYPYVGRAKDCPYDLDDEDEELEASFVYVPTADEAALKVAVSSVGPLSVAIDASHDTFRFYSEGVYYQSECDRSDLDHAVLVIGYGTDSKNRDYWLVKNSWGKSWGQDGYFKIARNRQNHCGIATTAIYPIV
ncbi:procathepsin L-like [Phymastichus coffea]|uniref:procathepsin L-like n=1 Tax=Phymastichus coffea TaxID=108790 RepID=UPI00273B2F6D|nr:procathepsin L-like [Phymastichus coffea]